VGLDPHAHVGRRRVEAGNRDWDKTADVGDHGCIHIGQDDTDDVEVAEAEGPPLNNWDFLGLDTTGEPDHQVTPASAEAPQ
jgi:hypothetical protein